MLQVKDNKRNYNFYVVIYITDNQVTYLQHN